MDDIYKLVIENLNAGKMEKQAAVQILKVLKREELKSRDDIAVIGVALRLPGAGDIRTYWENICNGVDSIGEFPRSRRKGVEHYIKSQLELDREARVNYMPGAYLEHIDKFDYKLFRLSPKEAGLMDPAQRLFLQVVYEALEDAGYGGRKLAGSKTGVYVGYSSNTDYRGMIAASNPSLLEYARVGNLPTMLPTRIAYLMDLRGPTMILDTACSASSVAIHLACQALRNAECELAIAGGVKINLFPVDDESVKLGVEASDGRTRSFDNNAGGSGWGEGVAAVLLKPLSMASRSRDNIYAVIKGSAINQDGTSIGITAPNAVAQTEVIRQAWDKAGIHPETISYIEAHGTATNLGDPLEIEGLQRAFRSYTGKKAFCAINSVKTNIGHLFECAGIAGFIKAVLALKHKRLPPAIHFNQPNKAIPFCDSPLYVNTRPRDWKRDSHPRRCVVSAFGLSGTNSHLVLEEYPGEHKTPTGEDRAACILTLSAKYAEGINILVRDYLDYLERCPGVSLVDICYTASTGRTHFNHRLAVSADSPGDLREKLQKLAQGGIDQIDAEWMSYGERRIVAANKEIIADNEFTERQKRELDQKSKLVLKQYLESKPADYSLLFQLVGLYAKGADPDWEEFYAGAEPRVISIPHYPFEDTSCWLEMPDAEQDDEFYYAPRWELEDLPVTSGREANEETLLLFREAGEQQNGLSAETEALLTESGKTVILVTVGKPFEKMTGNRYGIENSLDDYKRLLNELRARKVSRLVHMLTLSGKAEIATLGELEASREKTCSSLFYLSKAYAELGLQAEWDVILVSEYVNAVTDQEERLNPENAMLFGIGKVIRKEFPQLKCRCIDIDQHTSGRELLGELEAGYTTYCVAYRNQKRYIEVFSALPLKTGQPDMGSIKSEGVYVITGGTGGIGLAAARYLATQNRVRLALLSRSQMPGREEWDLILKTGSDPKLCTRIRALREIESTGAEVNCYSVDVSQRTAVEELIRLLLQKYGKINGIIHGAGVSEDKPLLEKTDEEFRTILAPKVQGTWILDKATRGLELDFFIMFSSVATIFSAYGQSDYVAANAYLDAFSAYRRKRGRKACTINWTTWKETGMAANSGPVVDTIFCALTTQSGIQGFGEVLMGDPARVLIGTINYRGVGHYLLERSGVRLSESIALKLAETGKAQSTGKRAHSSKSAEPGGGGVTLLGRDDGHYSGIEKSIAGICREVLGFHEIDIYDNFFELGADSILLMKIHERIEKLYPGKIVVVDMFEHSSISRLAAYMADADMPATAGIVTEINERSTAPAGDIAIIGISSFVPLADDLDELWENITNRVDCIETLPAARKDFIHRLLHQAHISPADIQFIDGSYLGEIDGFDYNFFGISPREAALIDPHQRLFLQSAWQAIEDAGYGGKTLIGSNTGVYLAYANTATYKQFITDYDPEALPVAFAGNIAAIASSRISHLLDLKGPSLVVDTACSSSLVAVHLACQAIKNRDCRQALVGGVKLVILPVARKKQENIIGIEAADNRTRSFDDSADGTGFGEGVATVLLKPLEDALAERDHIYALIKGSAVNQDGRSASLTAPNPAAQEAVIIKAWEDAGVEPETIAYIEAHGTGTRLGDPIEIKGIQGAFRRYTDKKQFCALSSVKSNLGHLSEAAGMSGLLKAVLALNYRKLPPGMHFSRPNKNISFGNSPVYVNTVTREWESRAYPRRCGLSGFGISGTNGHLVLEEAPAVAEGSRAPCTGFHIFTLSAGTRVALKNLIKSYSGFLESHPQARLDDICYTANSGRGHYNHRMVMILDSRAELERKMKRLQALLREYENSDTPREQESFSRISAALQWFKYREHRVVYETESNSGYLITEKRRRELSREADEKIAELVVRGDTGRTLLDELGRLYLDGAEPDWAALYAGKTLYREKLPVYPFEKNQCWIEVPEPAALPSETLSGGTFYQGVWLADELDGSVTKSASGTVLIFMDTAGWGSELAQRFHDAGREVIRVGIGSGFTAHNALEYTIGGDQGDYEDLLGCLKDKPVVQIVHLLSLPGLPEIKTAAELENTNKMGIYSLFYLLKAIVGAGWNHELDLAVISKYINEITGEEERLSPENAPLMGMCRVLGIEHPNLFCRCIDIDDHTGVDDVFAELLVKNWCYLTGYRKGKRFSEELRDVDPEYLDKKPIPLRRGGVYIITGGTGDMGFEVSRMLAAKARINLVLINRSGIPEREQWENILQSNSDIRLCKKIKKIKELEGICAGVDYYSADISEHSSLSRILEKIRAEYGRIDGIVHSAGVAGEGVLYRKEQAVFESVVNPKIRGTWLLDKLTREDNPDFFLLFSSIASRFSGPGQGDYAAANAYLDSFTMYRNQKGRRTLCINWATWRDTGMAVEYGVNVDGVFKALPTDTALDALYRVMQRDVKRILIGEVNYAFRDLDELERARVSLSYKLRIAIEKSRAERAASSKAADDDPVRVKLSGGEDDNYSELEERIAEFFGKVLGMREINIYAHFFDIGGDSIILNDLYALIEEAYPGKVRIVDLFKYTSVRDLSRFLLGGEPEATGEPPADELEDETRRIVDEIEKGNLSYQDAVDSMLNKDRGIS